MIEISSDKEKLDIDFIHDFLEKSYWAAKIPKDTQSFYRDHGFTAVANPEGHMELRNKPDYLQ